MKTIIILIIYTIMLVLLDNSKLKTVWVVYISFLYGFFAKSIAELIINLIIKL